MAMRTISMLSMRLACVSLACACSDDPAEPANQAGAMASVSSAGAGLGGGGGGAGSSATPVGTAGVAGATPTAGAAGAAGGSSGNGGSAAGSGAISGAGGSAESGSGGAVESGGASGASGAGAIDTGTLPAVTDPGEPGSFTPKWEAEVGPDRSYTTIAPMELAASELKHPIVIWGPGAGAYPEIYKTLLDHIASHGFVIVAYYTTPAGPELNAAIDWIIAESKRDGSPYFDKVDTTKIAMGGQSAGSLATFEAGDDERLTTTLHINGGTFNGSDVLNLIKPALFICGDDPAVSGGDGTWESDLARPNCDRDFMNAKVPVWYGVAVGSSHTTIIDNPSSGMPVTSDALKKPYLAANAAWLRWQLAGDQQMKALFVGPSCGFCTQTAEWLVQQKDLK